MNFGVFVDGECGLVGGKAPWLYSSRWLEASAKAEEATFKDFCLLVRSLPREQKAEHLSSANNTLSHPLSV